ncbi:MAG: 3'-5' exonuclease [Atopobiaceae bacterium]|nr:3'-5' exonuclease [Atopobiaceae bacterium]
MEALGKKRVGYSDASKRQVVRHSRNAVRTSGLAEYVVVDLETTGLSPEKNEILEIAALKVVNGQEIESYQRLVRPVNGLPDVVTKLTGLSADQVEQGVELSEAMESFLVFIGSCPLVMHNADFDMAFIDAALEQLDIDELDNECIDTLALARKRRPQEESYRLGDLVASLGVDKEGLHRAIHDCKATKVLFENLMALSP